MKGVDVVVHLAAQSNVLGAVADLEYSFSTNVIGTFNVLTAAAQAGVKRVLFASSREVYGEQPSLPVKEVAELKPKNAYGASKLAGETYCRVFRSGGLSVIILRLANVYGPGDRDRVIPIFVKNALYGNSLVLYGGDQLLDFVWVGTVVEAFERAMESGLVEDAVNIGSGIGTTVRDLAHTVVGRTGSDSAIVHAASRSCETTAFIADIRSAVQCGLINSPDDPLVHLDAVVNDMRNQLSADPISTARA
jgi:UDP-glucose 4-epimerase